MTDDEYPTCARTYATLRVYPGDIDPAAITDRLGIEPSSWQRRDEAARRAGGPPRLATVNGWFLESRGRVDSRDSRRHIDWLLDQLAPRAEAIRSLQERGCRMDISCYWLSRSGHGGPIIPPTQMRRLAELNIELGFDFYGPYEEDVRMGTPVAPVQGT
ncbi:hypothetical protein OJF2_14460 [Aquisphaera giovannonii]|uniref:DUF4279 domain-containing protein n=1 Tax=Aquisphaera giovannonii TaxID=406548 RepID=A0A5B9VY40_9BACT|nr:DUF4279 domain-containing protein [Aquisphaera giovannonii]QEH32954.1 hypothetical protein OJF2_14460 [Aquisphaera giovannonii]